MKTKFKNLIKGQWFLFDGEWWWKKSTRTARSMKSVRSFYFKQKEIVLTEK